MIPPSSSSSDIFWAKLSAPTRIEISGESAGLGTFIPIPVNSSLTRSMFSRNRWYHSGSFSTSPSMKVKVAVVYCGMRVVKKKNRFSAL